MKRVFSPMPARVVLNVFWILHERKEHSLASPTHFMCYITSLDCTHLHGLIFLPRVKNYNFSVF